MEGLLSEETNRISRRRGFHRKTQSEIPEMFWGDNFNPDNFQLFNDEWIEDLNFDLNQNS